MDLKNPIMYWLRDISIITARLDFISHQPYRLQPGHMIVTSSRYTRALDALEQVMHTCLQSSPLYKDYNTQTSGLVILNLVYLFLWFLYPLFILFADHLLPVLTLLLKTPSRICLYALIKPALASSMSHCDNVYVVKFDLYEILSRDSNFFFLSKIISY